MTNTIALVKPRTTISRKTQNTLRHQSKLRQAGVKSIHIDGSYVKIKGVNNNTSTFTREGAKNFIKKILIK